ncbi:MAG: PEP-CTERM sorting domain-containing protein [Halieaceae bacterium]|nr:PEP-CTERM sorting domain-containing protein [Halieaceae bacterium]
MNTQLTFHNTAADTRAGQKSEETLTMNTRLATMSTSVMSRSVIAASVLAASATTVNAADFLLNVAPLELLSGGITYDNSALSGGSLVPFDADTETTSFLEFTFGQFLATSIYDDTNFLEGGTTSFRDTNILSLLTDQGIPAGGVSGTSEGGATVTLNQPIVPDQVDFDGLQPLIPPAVNRDGEGFGLNWGLRVEYDFTGSLGPGGPSYTGGGFDVFLDTANYGLEATDPASGTLLFSAAVTGSQIQAANLNIFFDVTNALPGFLFTETGGGFTDVSTLSTPLPITLDTNVNPPIPDPNQLLAITDINDGTVRFARQTTLDGSVRAEVPAPATVALLGLGLLGMGARLRRGRK